MRKLDKTQALWDKRTQPVNLETIDISLRYLQIILDKMKGELQEVRGGVNHSQYKKYTWENIQIKAFDDEGSRGCIKGIQHQIDKAIIHAHHCINEIEAIKKGEEINE